MALMVNEACLLEGKTLSGEAESPLGATSALVICEVAKLLLSWLAIGEAVAIFFGNYLTFGRGD